jgi:O-6-methylguanine DNA methyltransferase
LKGDLYFTVGFELGKVVVFQDNNGRICRVTFDLNERFEERPSDSKAALEFAGYLNGKKTTLDFRVDLAYESRFRISVYRRVMDVPYSRTITYGEVAASIGRPNGARAVGQAMAANRFPLIIPCHRVVSGNGKIGGFSSGVELKRHLLKLEGIAY